jgi:aspartate aminotransferase
VIPSDFEVLLEPLERFESIRRKTVRLGDRLCDLSYANPYGGIEEDAKTAIAEALHNERLLSLQYSPFGGQTLVRRAVADALRETHRLPFTFEDIVLTPGAMAALHLALRVVGEPGDEVVIPVPCWLDFPLYARFVGLNPVTVPLAEHTFDLDVAALEGAMSERTCAVLFSHPANPTGRNYAPSSLERLRAAIQRTETRWGAKVTLIADETHRDFTGPGQYASTAAFFDRSLIVYSFGKYHFMQGQRLGYVATSPRHPERERVSSEMVRWTRVTGVATPTSLMQRALPRLLELRYEHAWVDEWRQRLVGELSAAEYSVVRPDATLFIYVRTPTGYRDFDFIEELASAGVLALPAPVFHHAGYFRLSLTGSEHMLERAIPVLRRFARR